MLPLAGLRLNPNVDAEVPICYSEVEIASLIAQALGLNKRASDLLQSQLVRSVLVERM